jgi:hypothetical protein
MKNKFNDILNDHYKTESSLPNFSQSNNFAKNKLIDSYYQTFNPNYKKELEDFKNSISLKRNRNYKENLFNNINSLNFKRPNSAKRIYKTISFFNNENKKNIKFPQDLFFNEEPKNVKIEKVIPGSRKVEAFKKNLEDDLRLFKNYKPMKRYYISNLRNVPSIYERNNFYSPRKNINPLFNL